MKPLNELAKEIYKNAKEKGFYDDPIEEGTRLMLVVSEISEALEADRKGCRARLDIFQKKQNSYNPDTNISEEQSFKENFETHIKDTFEDEIADSIIRLLDLCAYKSINIDKHIELKMRYNSLRPYRHGKRY